MLTTNKVRKIILIVIIFVFGFTLSTPTIITSANEKSSELRKSQKKTQSNEVKELPSVAKSSVSKDKKSIWTAGNSTPKYAPKELIVKLKQNSKSFTTNTNDEVKKVLNSALSINNTTVSSVKKMNSANVSLVKVNTNKNIVEVAKSLSKASSIIEYAEPNYQFHAFDISAKWTPSDSYYSSLWGLKNKGQSINGQTGTSGIDINVESAWSITKGSSNVTVAVIDSGIDYTHDDLKNNIWVNTKEIPNNYIDDDNNGYVDDVNGWDFYGYDNDPYDYSGHGTHVSGTIAASTNSSGVVGVAPNVKIMPLRFLDSSGYGYVSDAISAIEYAKKMNVKIVNNSWGSYSYSQALYDSIKNSGMLFIAAAGNEGYDNDITPAYPASYDLSNIISVAAIDNKGNLGYFTNYGAKSVDVVAPGVDIYSTTYYGGYGYASGTSMATPHVSGVAALVLSSNTSASTSTLKDAITKSVVKLSTVGNKVLTGGMINASAAMGGVSDDEIPGKTLGTGSTKDSLNVSKDRDDVYNINLSKGDVVTLTLSGASGTDFDLYLFNKGSKSVSTNTGILAYSENVGTSTEKIVYNIQESGTYYINVYAFKGTGSYTLTMKKGLTKGTYEDNSGILPKDDKWKKVSAASSSGGSYTTANSSGSSVTMKFTGTGVDITSLKNNKQGIVKITLDNKSYEVDLYSATTSYKASVFKKTGLTNGSHTLIIEWTGKPSKSVRKASGGTMINIDKITVY